MRNFQVKINLVDTFRNRYQGLDMSTEEKAIAFTKEFAWFLFKLFLVLLLVSLFSSILYYVFNHKPFILKGIYNDTKLSLEYELFQNIALIIISSAVAIIAWVQLSKIGGSAQVSYLLEFDKKWGSEELITARALIHKPYIECQKLNLNDADMFNTLGQYIIALSMQDNKPEDVKNFMYVLSLLNFFEAVGFIYNRTYLKPAKINELMGQSIKFYYKTFESYIAYRRNKHGDVSFHKEFEKMFESLL